ncbi:MAG: hypothetical protein Q9181_001078 [Wetmoreana brouardii]
MSRRVFDVGLDVDKIRNGLKLHSANKRSRNHRSASTSDARSKTPSESNQLALVPQLKAKRSSPSIRPDHSDHLQPFSPDDDTVVLPSISSPTTDDFPQPPVHTQHMNSNQNSPDGHMEDIKTSADDSHDFDLKPPPPRRPAKFLETYAEQLFSDAHLQTILRDSTFFMRFTAFLNRYKSYSAPILIRYLEIQKAMKAIEYANALAESLKPISGDSSSQIPCLAATIDSRFESRSRRAMDTLVNEALPAYITQRFTKIVTESMVREITGSTMPIMRELVGGLAEVFCLSDPSVKNNPIVYASEEFYRTTQYGRDYVIGRNCRFLQGPKTDRNTVARIREAIRTGQESFETILNYRRDGSPFMNLVMTAPLYDNKGVVRYFIGAQVDISGLVEEGRGLDSFEKLLNESRRKRNSDQSYLNQKHLRALSEFGQLLSSDESSIFHGNDGQGQSREGSVHDSEYGGSRGTRTAQQERQRYHNSRPPRRVLGTEDDDEQEKENNNTWTFPSVGPSGKLPGVYQNYLLLRPHPSLRIIFVSPALRIPGLLQSPFLSHIGGPARVRTGIAKAFENGEDITAKVTWLPQSRSSENEAPSSSSLPSRPASRHGAHPQTNNEGSPVAAAGQGSARTRYISCTPLLGSDDQVGVWMVVMVENETVTGSLPSRNNAITRYGHQHQNPEILPPTTPSEYTERENQSQIKNSDERVRSPAPSWRGTMNAAGTPKDYRHVNGNVGGRGVEREGDPGRMYAEFMRHQRGGNTTGSGGGGSKRFHMDLENTRNELNGVNGVNGKATALQPALATPVGGTGKVLGSEVGDEDGLLDGVGDGGR